MTKIIVIASTDLFSDQRVHRTSLTLHQEGYDVLTVGRRLTGTPKFIDRKYSIKLFRMVFRKGFLFYFFFNVRVLLFLLFKKHDLVFSNDLDSLLGCRLGCFFRRKPIVYDSHELFTDVPELINRPFAKKVWLIIEKFCFKGLKYACTVSEGIAREYFNRYGINMEVIRNLPFRNENFGHKNARPTIIYQGALNTGRGIELAIEMMNYLPCYYFLIVGSGDLEVKLRKLVISKDLVDRIEFKSRLTFHELHKLTCKAWLGISLEEDLGLSYRYALPNKLFDYIQAQVAVLVSNLPEMSKIVEEYGVGIVATTRDPKELADMVLTFLESKKKINSTIKNLSIAYNKLVWENEKYKLIELVRNALAG